MRITSKGQVTIPKDIREKCGLLPLTEVEFVVSGNSLKLRKVKRPKGKTRGELIVERMSGRGTIRMTTDQMMKLMRG